MSIPQVRCTSSQLLTQARCLLSFHPAVLSTHFRSLLPQFTLHKRVYNYIMAYPSSPAMIYKKSSSPYHGYNECEHEYEYEYDSLPSNPQPDRLYSGPVQLYSGPMPPDTSSEAVSPKEASPEAQPLSSDFAPYLYQQEIFFRRATGLLARLEEELRRVRHAERELSRLRRKLAAVDAEKALLRRLLRKRRTQHRVR